MTKQIIYYLLLLAGAFFAFAPHSVHLSLGLLFPHIYHVSLGVILLAIGGWMLIASRKA